MSESQQMLARGFERRLSPAAVFVLTVAAMLAFAGNSLLARLALKETAIDAVSFNTLRTLACFFVLWLIVRSRGVHDSAGSWSGAVALLVYGLAFSYAYVVLTAGSGALLLIGGAQLAMIGYALKSGERLRPVQVAGVTAAAGGLLALLLPGASAPPTGAAMLMLVAGVAWGVYSLMGRGPGDAIALNAGNFLRSVPLVVLASAIGYPWWSFDAPGVLYAIGAGALTTAGGYVIWYMALPYMKAMSASIVQLSIPVITSLGGVLFLAEPITLRLMLASIATLGGIALVMAFGRRSDTAM